MNAMIQTKTYPEPPICEREILRYAGCRSEEEAVTILLRSCLEEVREKLTYKVCWRELPVTINENLCDFGAFVLESQKLAKNLEGCKRAVLLAATVGIELDRLIAKYGRLSPARALLLQAIGAERIEALCDAFCADIAAEKNAGLKPRFSPGYGDLPLLAQRDIFAVLDCAKRIGLCLNDSMLMSPSKSVTAFAGIIDRADEPEPSAQNKCVQCEKKIVFSGVCHEFF